MAEPANDAKSVASDSDKDKDKEPLKQIGRGFLMILSTPLAVAGMGLCAAGTALEGVSLLLKGMGAVGKIPLEKVREAAEPGEE